MLKQMIAMMREVEQNEEFFEIMARMSKKMFDALVKAGFKEDQAIKIVAGQGVGVGK